MPQNRIIYAFILLLAAALLGSALVALHRVRLSGKGVPTRETFAVETPEQRDLGDRLDRLEKTYQKGDRREAFVLEQKLPEVSETALYQEFQSTNSLARKMALIALRGAIRNFFLLRW